MVEKNLKTEIKPLHSMLFKVLESIKCPPTIISLLIDMQSNTSASVKM